MARETGVEAKADVAVDQVDARVAAAVVAETKAARAKAARPKVAARASS